VFIRKIKRKPTHRVNKMKDIWYTLHTHTYIHNSYIHTYMHTYIHIYIHTHTHTHIHTQTHTHTWVHTYIRTYNTLHYIQFNTSALNDWFYIVHFKHIEGILAFPFSLSVKFPGPKICRYLTTFQAGFSLNR